MSSRIEVASVNISRQKGTIKVPVEEIALDSRGVVGDAHAGAWHRQVSLLSEELIEAFAAANDRPTKPGEFAENITIRGLDLRRVGPLDRFRISEAELEVTQIGKECHAEGCAIYREVGACLMPQDGLFARVIHGGSIRRGDIVDFHPKRLDVRVVTLSDRAFAGEYEDQSGPRLSELLDAFFAGTRWHVAIQTTLLPDDPDRLRRELEAARQDGADIIFTTGGTGVGPRDTTPDVAVQFCEKLIPGIMDHVRLKCGARSPGALLSRSVAGVAGTTQLYTLPGSVKAVEEYMAEILKTLEHLIYSVHGIDRH